MAESISRDIGLNEEVEFWEEQMSGQGQYSQGVLTRFNMSSTPPEYRTDFEPLIMSLRSNGTLPRVLDVGAGPASVFSWGALHGKFELIAADPLADKYKVIAQKYGLKIPCETVNCGGEELLGYFEEGTFDFAWSWNSIDHAVDPIKVFECMVRVTRPGGIVAIQAFDKEGSAAGWTGLHQYDITASDSGEMVVTNKQGISQVVTHEKAQRFDLPFKMTIVPKMEGRQWLSFFYKIS